VRYIKTCAMACASLLLAGCAGTFSGSDDAYLKDSRSLPPTHNTKSVKVKHERQYLPAEDELTKPGYTPPSMVPPGERVSTNSKAVLTGPNASILIVRAKLPVVWKQLAAVLPRTPYSIMDKDETLHSYFVVDKVKTGGSIKRSSPIYQLALSSKGKVTELHLLDSKNADVDPKIAGRVMQAIEKNYT
jgi:uncharacterized lipoprotein